MAALIPEIASEELLGVPRVESDPQRRRRPRIRFWRGIVLFFAGVYFLIPIYAGLRFSLQNDAGQFSLYAVRAIPSQVGFSAAFFLSLRLAAVTTVLTMVLMVPTATYVHLKLPRMRRVLDFVTILPIVIPPIVLILGVLHAAPLWLRSSPYLLSLIYVILALPFVYRSLDAGLSAIDLKTLVEASRSLGGKWVSTLLHVILPNIRAAMLSATVLTIALVLVTQQLDLSPSLLPVLLVGNLEEDFFLVRGILERNRSVLPARLDHACSLEEAKAMLQRGQYGLVLFENETADAAATKLLSEFLHTGRTIPFDRSDRACG